MTTKKKILLVDDEDIIRDVFVSILPEYEIIPASSGKEAVESINSPLEFDLALVDISLPDISSGVKLIIEIKRLRPRLKIIVMSGLGLEAIKVRGLNDYVHGYIEKPFDVHIVKDKLKKIFLGVTL